ncbi:MAG TPA: 50S ribosomal protein L15 [Patescibacteria group bacterium]
MNLSSLVQTTKRSKKRKGQGHGSGKVKTSGRGQKGQNSRNKVPFTRYSGGSLAFVKRLPFLRGKDKNNSFKLKPVLVNVSALNGLSKGTTVDLKSLVASHLVNENEAKKNGIKILGNGELTVALTVSLPVSKGALVKIEKAGGKVA